MGQDALSQRIEKQKQHSQAGRNHYTETTQYGWDGDTLAYESTNLYTKHYVYENGSFVPLIQATYRQQINQHQTPSWEHGYDYDKDPLWHTAQKANPFDRVWFYHCDHLGTPQEMSDQTGTIVWSANYKAWGECKTENHTKRDIWDSEIITNNIRFQGQYYDDETGLHYNRYRYYSPYVGRFISKDPIGLLGGLNTFAYAPNPVEWIDPLGLTPKKKDCCEEEDPCTALINAKSTKQFGHSFLQHGQQKSRASMVSRAENANPNQGRWLDNNVAAMLLAPYRGRKATVDSVGKVIPIEVSIPQGVGEIIRADGSIQTATKMRVVLEKAPNVNGKNCIDVAYPIP